MLAQLIMIVIVIAMNRCLFDGAVHPLDLAIGPRMLWLGEPVINVVSGTSTFKRMAPEQFSFRPHFSDVGRRPAPASWIGELNAIVCENRMYFVWDGSNEIAQELL